jgi:hypothetical protein
VNVCEHDVPGSRNDDDGDGDGDYLIESSITARVEGWENVQIKR